MPPDGTEVSRSQEKTVSASDVGYGLAIGQRAGAPAAATAEGGPDLSGVAQGRRRRRIWSGALLLVANYADAAGSHVLPFGYQIWYFVIGGTLAYYSTVWFGWWDRPR